ncbi:MAG: D-aminoacyl-tRNA deacylase, partial [Spirochaetales bacterium]|nr:D-aminoacyl-tRNA deacylase [Spirochaetales bacterium]
MRAVVQRVRDASVTVDGAVSGKIGYGLLIYLGVVDSDSDDICRKMAAKISKMRLFRDSDDKMNLSVSDVGGDILVVSQFT